jgi:hypothetical protein
MPRTNACRWEGPRRFAAVNQAGEKPTGPIAHTPAMPFFRFVPIVRVGAHVVRRNPADPKTSKASQPSHKKPCEVIMAAAACLPSAQTAFPAVGACPAASCRAASCPEVAFLGHILAACQLRTHRTESRRPRLAPAQCHVARSLPRALPCVVRHVSRRALHTTWAGSVRLACRVARCLPRQTTVSATA